MRGEFIGVWSETWQEIWTPLICQEGVPENIFCEHYCGRALAPNSKPSNGDLADMIDHPVQGRAAFEQISSDHLAICRAFVSVMQAAHTVLNDLGGEARRTP